jgi:hypothetical protein
MLPGHHQSLTECSLNRLRKHARESDGESATDSLQRVAHAIPASIALTVEYLLFFALSSSVAKATRMQLHHHQEQSSLLSRNAAGTLRLKLAFQTSFNEINSLRRSGTLERWER